MASRTVTTISEGISFNYLIKGTFLAIASGIISVFFLPAVIGVPVGIALILASSGVEIDTEAKKYRKYAAFFGFKVGDWKQLNEIVKVELYQSTQQHLKRTLIMSMVSKGGEKIYHKTYDVIISNNKDEKILVNDFDVYYHAIKCFRALETTTDTKGVNHYSMETSKIIERRKKRKERRR